MTADPAWLPGLLVMADYDNSWEAYIAAVYGIFETDFVTSQPLFNGRSVRCRRDPLYEGKEAGFWHCVQEGADEAQRTPDLRRCERVGWIRAIIVNCSATEIDHWRNENRGELRHYIWFAEQYLIVLADRKRQFQLITAFCTDRQHTIRKLSKERDASAKN